MQDPSRTLKREVIMPLAMLALHGGAIHAQTPGNPAPSPARLLTTAALVSDPSHLRLTIVPNAGHPGNYDFEWNSHTGMSYDLVSATDLTTNPVAWPVWNSLQSLPASATGSNVLANIPGGGDTRRFFAVIEHAPPLLSTDFETSDGGFTATTSAGTSWAWGTPISTDNNGVSNFGGSVTSGNGGSSKCWGTNIGNPGYYANPTTNSCLRSPDIDLTRVSGAHLTFAEALDIAQGDTAVVKLFDAGSNALLATVYTATDADLDNANWSAANGGVPIDLNAGIGKTVYLQWCFTGTGEDTQDYMGWYVDDVVVNPD